MQQQSVQQKGKVSLENLCDRLFNCAQKTDYGRSLISFFGIKNTADEKFFEHLNNLTANAPEFRKLNSGIKEQLKNIRFEFPNEILDLHYKLINIERNIHYTIKEETEKVKLIFKINSENAISAAQEVCPGITIEPFEPNFKIPIPAKFAKLRDDTVIELDNKIRRALRDCPESTFSLAIKEATFLQCIANEIDTYEKGHLQRGRTLPLSEEMVQLVYSKLKDLPQQRVSGSLLQFNKAPEPFETATIPAKMPDRITALTGIVLNAISSITAGTEEINLEAIIKALSKENEITIGRSPLCDIQIDKDEVTVSKNHLTLSIKNGQLLIKDNHSTNGTYINGVKYTSGEFVLVSNLSKIQLGRNILPPSTSS